MLNELVDSHAAKEGTVQFAFPETANSCAADRQVWSGGEGNADRVAGEALGPIGL